MSVPDAASAVPITSPDAAWTLLNGPVIARALGYFAALCFTVQYFPQAWLNFRRHSIKGFSLNSILLKHIGACFLAVDAALMGETLPAVMYGVFNIIQHSIFMIQFTWYTHNPVYLAWLLFPMLPYFLGITYPESLPITSYIKPIAQVFSHIPQLWVSWREGSTVGISLWTQHLNMLGGVAGLYKFTTTLVYLNSMFQAISTYVLAMYLDSWPFSPRRDVKQSVEETRGVKRMI